MSNKIEFKNLETNTKLSFDLDKEFIVIFGKNGAGKTTISRNAPNPECVFNTDFIHRNIYVELPTGATDDKNTKEAFSRLWVGESIVKIKKELEYLRVQKEKISKLKDELWAKVIKDFNDKGVHVIDATSVNNLIDKIVFKKPNNITDEEIIKGYNPKIILNTTIKNDSELKQSITRLNNNELVNLLIKELKANELLNQLFLVGKDDEKNKLLKNIIKFNQISNNLKKLDECFKADDVKKEEQWLRDALLLHENADSCYFCGNPNIQDAINKWQNILNSKLKSEANSIVEYVNSIIKVIDSILKRESNYSKVASNTIISIKKLNNYLCDVISKMTLKEIIDENIVFPDIKKDDLVTEENKFVNNVQNYIFKKYLPFYEILYLLLKDYTTAIVAKDDQIEKEMSINANSIAISINKHLNDLDLDKELTITIDKRGNDKKYKFSFLNPSTKISTLSDGQKHKIALAIFFASIEKYDLSDKVVVLDDPIVTLDYRSYYSIKSKIIKLRNEKKPATILLLTYNIDYLYIQLTNYFNKEDVSDVKMLHLTSDAISEIDYNIINYDDLSLFKNGLDCISSLEEFNLIASLNVRIYRMFLDLYLRMHGYPSNGNPKDEIMLITDLDSTKKSLLLKNNSYIEKYCRKASATNEELFNTFIKTNEFVICLGFPALISEDAIEKLRLYSNTNKRAEKYEGNNLLFLIIARAVAISNSTNPRYETLKNYLNHPRTQLTSSIVGVDFSDLEIAKL